MDMQGKDSQRLTAEDVRRIKGFETKTDEEVGMIILSLEKLALLIHKKINNHKYHEQARAPD